MGSVILTEEMIRKKTVPIFRNYPVEKAVLFGSYSKNNVHSNSDVDLYIDTNNELKGLDFVGLLDILTETLGTEIDLIDRSHIEEGSLIFNEIQSGGTVIYEKSKDC
ncbi:MAG: nucleotidyltransferase domain-containing protein [Clostridia bacterium]|nr:nucleotidyltransferase domain-containing protein [Clostridia bacterium]